MKRLAVLALSLCLFLFLAGCGQNANTQASSAGEMSSPSGSTDTNSEISEVYHHEEYDYDGRETLDLSDWSKLPEPDEIVFYQNARGKHFLKGSPEYQEVFTLNQARFNGVIDLEKERWQMTFSPWEYVDPNDSGKYGNPLLEYRYSERYFSVYFNLDVTETYNLWISTYTRFTFSGLTSLSQWLYGQLPEPTALREYLDSLQ